MGYLFAMWMAIATPARIATQVPIDSSEYGSPPIGNSVAEGERCRGDHAGLAVRNCRNISRTSHAIQPRFRSRRNIVVAGDRDRPVEIVQRASSICTQTFTKVEMKTSQKSMKPTWAPSASR